MRDVPGAAPRSSGSRTWRAAISRSPIHPVLQLAHTSWNTMARASAAQTYVVPLNSLTGSRTWGPLRTHLGTTCSALRKPDLPQKTHGVVDFVIPATPQCTSWEEPAGTQRRSPGIRPALRAAEASCTYNHHGR